MSVISMKQLLEAGVHFGHQTRKWNPKMAKYIYTSRNDIHVINLEQTSELIDVAYAYIRDAVKDGKRVLFVGTKKQAQDAVKEEAAGREDPEAGICAVLRIERESSGNRLFSGVRIGPEEALLPEFGL